MGVILAHFQSGGKEPLLNDLLNRIDSGTEINSLTDFIIVIGHPSCRAGRFVILQSHKRIENNCI